MKLAGLTLMLQHSKWLYYLRGIKDQKIKYLMKILDWLQSCLILNYGEHYGLVNKCLSENS